MSKQIKRVNPHNFKSRLRLENKDKNTTVKDERLEMLVTIVNRPKAEFYIDLIQAFEVNMQLVLPARGTADAKTLAYYGLEDSDKAILIGMIRRSRIAEVLGVLENKFRTIKNGKGIAFTVPLDGVIGTLIFGFLSNNKQAVPQKEKEK